MSNVLLKTIFIYLIFFAVILIAKPYVYAQTGCVSDDEVKQMIATMREQRPIAVNEKLKKELVKMRENFVEKYRYAAALKFQDKNLNKEITKVRDKNDERFCALVKEFGWPTIRLAGEEGAEAALSILRNAASLQFQANMLPVVAAAVKNLDARKDEDYAAFVDRLRVRAGKRQLFGTQTVKRGDFLVLLPLLSEKRVDEWRQEYQMPPLADSLKSMELLYRQPVLRTARGDMGPIDPDDEAFLSALDSKGLGTANILPGQAEEEEEIIKVKTSLVMLPVFVYDPANDRVNTLAQKDFEVYEDKNKEPITFFSTADTPFDLVLLIDLSGSTEGKVGLIRNATNQFIEAKRPADRLAIVTFSDKTTVVSELTDDRQKLLAGVKTMAEKGGSRVWDALKFTVENMFGPKTTERRRAVVFLTDGLDNALFGDKRGSKTGFNELLDSVRESEASVFPIYLDSESKFPYAELAFKTARSTLAMLADETGGSSYKAKKIEDLDGVYTQVLNDLSRIYTIGYVPTNEKQDGSWRAIRVTIPGHPDLVVKTKPGYFTK